MEVTIVDPACLDCSARRVVTVRVLTKDFTAKGFKI
jgi:hypothetical protein